MSIFGEAENRERFCVLKSRGDTVWVSSTIYETKEDAEQFLDETYDTVGVITWPVEEKLNPCDACQTWDMPEACQYCSKPIEHIQCKDFVSWPAPDESSDCNRGGGRCPCGGNLNKCSIKPPVEDKKECPQCEGTREVYVFKSDYQAKDCQICGGEGEVG